MKLRIFATMLACCLMAAAVFPAAAEEEVTARSLIERTVVSYAADRIRDEKALSVLSSVDSSLGEKWARIMDLWEAPVPVTDSLPDSLRTDDSLCLVALGFQLNPDGTMRDELIERLKVLLRASEQYPKNI